MARRSGNWFRSYGNENWDFDENRLATARHASINDLPIREEGRKYHWPLERRPQRSSESEQLRILKTLSTGVKHSCGGNLGSKTGK
jgi:nuclear transport factor 2 (NTF2) superfamily protein